MLIGERESHTQQAGTPAPTNPTIAVFNLILRKQLCIVTNPLHLHRLTLSSEMTDGGATHLLMS